MQLKSALSATTVACLIVTAGCKPKTTTNTAAPAQSTSTPTFSRAAGPLPDKGFQAQITPVDLPSRLRMGQKETITVKIKNTSDVVWWQRGGETNDRSDNKFYIALGNHWLDKDEKRTSDLEGHNGIPRDLKPGEESEMTLLITAPKEPGEYTIEFDMVQEGVSWFGDKGSSTTKAKVTVLK